MTEEKDGYVLDFPNPATLALIDRIRDEFAHRKGITAWAKELLELKLDSKTLEKLKELAKE